jgi:DNA-binding NarL/FixJ family response regulator
MKCLIVDDHSLIRDAMRGVLRSLKGDDIAIGEAINRQAALEHIDLNPDLELVLLDLTLPDTDGMELLAEIGARYPALAVVVLSAHQDQCTVASALRLGALGFIPKSSPREILLGALNLIFAGGRYVPPEILGASSASGHVETPPSENLFSLARRFNLTRRQAEVLSLMMRGGSNKEICRALGLSESTVKIHVSAILKALGVRNRTEAVLTATHPKTP